MNPQTAPRATSENEEKTPNTALRKTFVTKAITREGTPSKVKRVPVFQEFAEQWNDPQRKRKSCQMTHDCDLRRMRSDLSRNKRFFRQTDLALSTVDDVCSLRLHHNASLRKTEPCKQTVMAHDQAAGELRRLQNVLRPHTTGHTESNSSASRSTWWFEDRSTAIQASTETVPRVAESSSSCDSESRNTADLIPVTDFLMWIKTRFHSSMKEAFEFIDADHDSMVTKEEFMTALTRGHFDGDKEAIFGLIDKDHSGAVTLEQFRNLAPHFKKMLHSLTIAQKKLGGAGSASGQSVLVEKQPLPRTSMRPTRRIWLFRNADAKHKGTTLLLKHTPQDMFVLYELCMKACNPLSGRVVALYDIKLQRIKAPNELVHEGKYVVCGAETLVPPESFWGFTRPKGQKLMRQRVADMNPGALMNEPKNNTLKIKRSTSCPAKPKGVDLSLSLPQLL